MRWLAIIGLGVGAGLLTKQRIDLMNSRRREDSPVSFMGSPVNSDIAAVVATAVVGGIVYGVSR